MTPKYQMPTVQLGDSVIWAHDATRIAEGAPGIVTRIGVEAIGLIFFPPDSRAGTPRDGVRFHLDPANLRTQSDAGVFAFGPQHGRLEALEALVAGLIDLK